MQKNIQSPYAPALRLAELNRWSEGERLLIQYCRVERTLRNSFFNNEWRQISMFHQDRLNPLFFCLNHSPLSLNFHLLSSDGRPLVLDWFLSEPQERQNSHAHYPFADVLEILSISPDYDPAVLSVTELDEYRRMQELFPCVMTVSLVKHFSEYFKISNALDSAWIQEKQVVKPVDAVLQSANWQQCPTIIFHGRENAPQFFLHQRICGERVLLLPVVFFLYDFLPDIVFPMYEIPYSDKVPFYNADMIAANPGSTIILSDELAVPLVNDSSKDCVFTSWYGGMEAASKLDFALLAGHPVELLCFERRNAQNVKENVIRIIVLDIDNIIVYHPQHIEPPAYEKAA